MKCEKCGAENAEDAKVCQECGQPLGTDPASPAEGTVSASGDTAASQAKESGGEAPVLGADQPILSKKTFIGICIGVAAFFVIVALVVILITVANSAPTIKLDDYLTIEVTGYDSFGTAKATIDWKTIEDKYGSRIKYNDNSKMMEALMTPMEAFKDCVSVYLNPAGNLSNGSSLNYSWNVSSDLKKYLNVTVEYKNGTQEVSGLSEVETVNLDKYLKFEASGYDGYGTLECRMDWEALEKDYKDKIPLAAGAGSAISLAAVFDDYIGVRLDKTSGLSNGDTVSYTWRVNDRLTKYVICKPVYKDGTTSVTGLTKVEGFDAFADVEVAFSGIAPKGQAEMTCKGDLLDSRYYTLEPANGLKNGDTVTLSLRNTDKDFYVREFGKTPEAYTKDYTVSGLSEYVSSYADLSKDFLDKVKTQAEDVILSYAAKSYSKASSLKNLEYAGYAFLSLKEDVSYSNSRNNLYVIYKGDLSSSEDAFYPAKVYFPVRYYDLLISSDKEVSLNNEGDIIGSSDLDGGLWISTRGYINPLTAYKDIVVGNKDKFKAECGDGFENYDEMEEIEDLEDISKEYKDSLYKDAVERIEAYVEKSYNGGSIAENYKYAGEYLLVAKDQGEDYKNNNTYIVVVSAKVSNTKDKFEEETVYFPVEYAGLVKMNGDEFLTTSIKGILGNSELQDSGYYTKGYIDGEEMYSDIVTANRDKYTYDVSKELVKFGK